MQTDCEKNLANILDQCSHIGNITPELRQILEYRMSNSDKCIHCIHHHLIDLMVRVRRQHSLPDLNALLPTNCSSCDTTILIVLPNTHRLTLENPEYYALFTLERNLEPIHWQYLTTDGDDVVIDINENNDDDVPELV